MVRVKICGITRDADANVCVRRGADAIGFVFAASPRRISPDKAKRIIHSLPPWVAATGVFVNERASEVLRVAKFCRLQAVQLHGDEDEAMVRSLQQRGLSVIKAFRVSAKKDFEIIKRCRADAVLLDTAVPGSYGGSGVTFEWGMLRHFRCPKPVIVSGGLRPDNVAGLLRVFKPYAVDVSSGVENKPGIKDAAKINEFIKTVMRADEN